MTMPAKRKSLAEDLQRRVRPRRETSADIELQADEAHQELNANHDSSVQTDSDQVRSSILSQKLTLTTIARLRRLGQCWRRLT